MHQLEQKKKTKALLEPPATTDVILSDAQIIQQMALNVKNRISKYSQDVKTALYDLTQKIKTDNLLEFDNATILNATRKFEAIDFTETETTNMKQFVDDAIAIGRYNNARYRAVDEIHIDNSMITQMEIHTYGNISDKYRQRWNLQQKRERIANKMI